MLKIKIIIRNRRENVKNMKPEFQYKNYCSSHRLDYLIKYLYKPGKLDTPSDCLRLLTTDFTHRNIARIKFAWKVLPHMHKLKICYCA